VKLEGGAEVAATVASIVAMGVPVLGHVGLTPQSVHAMGGYRVQGRDEGGAQAILDGARALEEAGAFGVVLEGVPRPLAGRVTAALGIPTIGIGAGPACDGQVLLTHDLLGLYGGHRPKFVKRYAACVRRRGAPSGNIATRCGEGSFLMKNTATIKVLKGIGEMHRFSLEARKRGARIALVPTMGALHAGHLALVKAARRKADTVVVSIFVNPTQFGPREDLSAYPRDLAGDIAKLGDLGVAAVFAPEAAEMFPPGHRTHVEVEDLSGRLCGRARPTHFRGVATVVAKLFAVVQPHHAWFGQKDYQQLLIVRKMARDLNLDVEVFDVPTVRDADGLALSSRNAYLTPEQRPAALSLQQALHVARRIIAKGERSAAKILSTCARSSAPRPAPTSSTSPSATRDAPRPRSGRDAHPGRARGARGARAPHRQRAHRPARAGAAARAQKPAAKPAAGAPGCRDAEAGRKAGVCGEARREDAGEAPGEDCREGAVEARGEGPGKTAAKAPAKAGAAGNKAARR